MGRPSTTECTYLPTCGILGHLAPVHQCSRPMCCVACAVSWATWLLVTGVRASSFALLVRCPGPLGSCSPLCPLGVLCCGCGGLGHLGRDHRCARSVCCVPCAVAWAIWCVFTGRPAPSVALLVRCPGPLGSCSPVCPLGVFVFRVRCPGPLGCCSAVCALRPLHCLCGILSHLAPVHRCTRSVCCVACAVSWAA